MRRRLAGADVRFGGTVIATTLALACASPPIPPTTGSPPPSVAQASIDAGLLPGLNEVETRISKSLSALGISSVQAEDAAFGGSMWSQFDDGSALYVTANPLEADHAEFSVVAQREIQGVAVQRVAYASGAVRDRFRCDGLVFEVEGTVPPRFGDKEAFLGKLVAVLDCAS